MANPTPYKRGYSFTGYQANSPTDPLPGNRVDVELDEVSRALGKTIDGLADIRRSDGMIVNKKVAYDTLNDDLRLRLMKAGNSITVESFDSVPQAASADIPGGKGSIYVGGRFVAGDPGAALFRRLEDHESSQTGDFASVDGARWTVAETEVNPTMFGALGTGGDDDTAAVVRALSYGNVRLPEGAVYLIGGPVVVGARTRITGPGTLKLSNLTSLRLEGEGAVVEGVSFVSVANSFANAAALVACNAPFTTVRNCRFTGQSNPCVQVTKSFCNIENNFFDGGTGSGGNAVIVTGADATRVQIRGNRLSQVRGFGLQTRLGATKISILDNVCYMDVEEQTSSPEDGVTTIHYETLRENRRWSVKQNGVPMSGGYSVNSASNPFITVTLTTPANGTDEYTLVSAYGLEAININSQSYDILVSGNSIDGSGDSGIVVGSDYHNGIIDPGNTGPEDYPERVQIVGNTIANPMFAAVAMTNPAPNVVVTNNTCRDWARGSASATFGAAIVLTGQGIARDNILIGNGQTTRYGVTFNGFAPRPAMTDGDAWVKIGSQHFNGVFTQRKVYIPATSASSRKDSVFLPDQPWLSYPAQIDLDSAFFVKPSDNNYFTYSNTGDGWERDATDKLGGVASAFATGGVGTQTYVSANLLAREILLDTILRVELIAKADSGTGFITVFAEVAGSTAGPRMEIAASGWTKYTYYIAITSTTQTGNPITVRIGADPNSVMHFQYPVISYQRIPR